MIPKLTQFDTHQVPPFFKLVGADEAPSLDKPAGPACSDPRLRPELRQALEASWGRNEEAYRYLGR